MSAPHIPNLLSMRRGGGPRVRGAGRRAPPGQGHSPQSASPVETAHAALQHDLIVQQTDTDALHSRISAVDIGYIDDRYAESFTLGASPRRMPIINRGTYVRTEAIDTLVENFLRATDGEKQIISLGAGTDTRYWRLMEKNMTSNLHYHEVDFPRVSANKIAAIRSSPILSDRQSPFFRLHQTPPQTTTPLVRTWGFATPRVSDIKGYFFHPLDLRSLADPAFTNDKLPSQFPSSMNPKPPFDMALNLIHPGLPTLLVSECCLCYLETNVADRVLEYFTTRVVNIGVVLYEPTSPNDEFGQMMFKNLAARNLSMPTVHSYPDFKSQRERLGRLGFWTSQRAVDVDWLWENWFEPEERERVNTLEGLDEIEEWKLLAGHYSISWAYKEKESAKGVFSKAWEELGPDEEEEQITSAHDDVTIVYEADDEPPLDWAGFENWAQQSVDVCELPT